MCTKLGVCRLSFFFLSECGHTHSAGVLLSRTYDDKANGRVRLSVCPFGFHSVFSLTFELEFLSVY